MSRTTCSVKEKIRAAEQYLQEEASAAEIAAEMDMGKRGTAQMCKSLEVSRSGYYKWLKHEKTDEEKENEQIAQLVGEYDERFNHTLGYRRMTGYMNRLNQKQYGEKRIYRIMKMMGIRSVIRKKAKKYQHCEPEMVAESGRDSIAAKKAVSNPLYTETVLHMNVSLTHRNVCFPRRPTSIVHLFYI